MRCEVATFRDCRLEQKHDYLSELTRFASNGESYQTTRHCGLGAFGSCLSLASLIKEGLREWSENV